MGKFPIDKATLFILPLTSNDLHCEQTTSGLFLHQKWSSHSRRLRGCVSPTSSHYYKCVCVDTRVCARVYSYCVSAVLRVGGPDFSWGTVVMTGIQLDYHDLILQERPVKQFQPSWARPDRQVWTDRGEGGGWLHADGLCRPPQALKRPSGMRWWSFTEAED